MQLQSHLDFFAHRHDLRLGLFHGVAASKQHAQATVALEFGLAEQAERSVRFSKHFFEAAKLHMVGIAVNHDRLRGTRAVERDVRDRQAQDSAGVQRKFRKVLADKRHHAGIVRTRGYFAEQHLVLAHEEFHAEDAAAAEGVRHLF